jgi:hypothetical protein
MVWVRSNRAIAVIAVSVLPAHTKARTIMSMMIPTIPVRRYSLFFIEPDMRFFNLLSIEGLKKAVCL